ncbi:hypothetical protein H2200_010540 [Cladophialophora chaetospira]|uniref:Xylanolytic transcriptional activator regulatory domain-containing protein n=1 Tax=Cladophialophora chaetospira TaxID=386627 RepID=A0AA39CE82_9EURO|nr:hypothetical protein H2200_010540 [Cladophialophora chaetospira]
MPTCDKCTASRETCEYDRGPSVSYAISLEKRLRAFETRFEKLRQSTSAEERDALILKPFEKTKPERARRLSADTPGPEESHDEAPDVNTAESSSPVRDAPPDEASVGMDGRVEFYGKTSHYHVDPREEDGGEDMLPGNMEPVERQPTHQHLSIASTIYTTPDVSLTAEPAGPPQVLSELTSEFLDHLLDAYWCWAQHLHLVLNRRLFLRDLFVSGPWVTPFLICSVLAQAARYSTRPEAAHIGNHFAARALQLLADDIDRGSSILTLQGLLILSARECACGRTSQGWLYSGMAFRMMRELGIHIDSKKMSYLTRQYSEEELAMRQQVFWSCFTWDKTMSLCLGRAPIIHDMIDFPSADTLIDGRETDEESWRPVLGQEQESIAAFIEQKSLGGARFAAYCKLCAIIDGVLDGLYCRPHQSKRDRLLAFLENTIRKLEDWSANLPEGLFISAEGKVVLCPPIHILLLNLTYHATMILLCRPYRKLSTKAQDLCTKAAQMIDSLFTLHVRRFGYRFITYLQTYTMFVACTINVLDLKENESSDQGGGGSVAARARRLTLAQEASVRLNFGLEILRQAGATPSAARCAAVIVQLLRQWSDKRDRRSRSQNSLDHGVSSLTPGRQPSSYVTMPGASPQQQAAPPVQPIESLAFDASLPSDALSPSASGLANSAFSTDRPLPTAQHSQGLGQTLSPGVPNGMAFRYDDSMGLQSFGSSGSPYVDPNIANFGNHLGIETPMRWLPDNIEDDGSWMLMTDFGNGYLEV